MNPCVSVNLESERSPLSGEARHFEVRNRHSRSTSEVVRHVQRDVRFARGTKHEHNHLSAVHTSLGYLGGGSKGPKSTLRP